MCFQNTFFSRNQVVCIVFHEGSTLWILHTGGHDLHQANHSCCLPVTFRSESITFFHQSLHSQTRKLLQCSQITEVSNDCLIILLFQELFKTNLNGSLHCYMLLKFLRISSLQNDIVLAVILFYQSVDLILWNSRYIFSYFVYRISIYFPAKLDLSFYLVAFGNGYVSHIICHTAYTDMTALHDTDCSKHPAGDSFLHFSVSPVTYDYFSLDSHSGNNVAIFSVTMCRLILIHEVHINGIIWNLTVKLCMKVHQRLAVLLQTKNP